MEDEDEGKQENRTSDMEGGRGAAETKAGDWESADFCGSGHARSSERDSLEGNAMAWGPRDMGGDGRAEGNESGEAEGREVDVDKGC